MRVLTVNAGSTSLKLAPVVDGEAGEHYDSLDAAFADAAPDLVAHRVVHGGGRTEAALVTDGVRDELEALAELAPLHQPPALAAIDRCRRRWPDVPNVACFDTAFHATIPEAARTYALPERFRHVVRQYGFHGLSHAWAAAQARALVPHARRVLIAHLGGGQSLCAALDGRSVATTMGFTPVDGLVMATRPGAVDPGAVAWIARHLEADDDLDDLLERRSGLFALGGSGDMRELRAAAAAGDGAAAFALDVWRHRIVSCAGACIAAMAGLDALVFTGGIGEHDPVARAALVDGLGWLGGAVDAAANERNDADIAAAASAVAIRVVAAREDLQLASEAEACVARR